jgi:hypothetical protein
MQTTFLLPWGVDTNFKSNLHHIQVGATHILVAMGCWYNFQVWFAPHTSGCNPHSCYHGVLIQISGLICTTYKWVQPTSLLPWGVDTIFKFDLHNIQMDATQLFCFLWNVDVVFKSNLQHIQMDATQLSCYHGCDVIYRYDFNHMQMYAIQLACFHQVLNAWLT